MPGAKPVPSKIAKAANIANFHLEREIIVINISSDSDFSGSPQWGRVKASPGSPILRDDVCP